MVSTPEIPLVMFERENQYNDNSPVVVGIVSRSPLNSFFPVRILPLLFYSEIIVSHFFHSNFPVKLLNILPCCICHYSNHRYMFDAHNWQLLGQIQSTFPLIISVEYLNNFLLSYRCRQWLHLSQCHPIFRLVKRAKMPCYFIKHSQLLFFLSTHQHISLWISGFR